MTTKAYTNINRSACCEYTTIKSGDGPASSVYRFPYLILLCKLLLLYFVVCALRYISIAILEFTWPFREQILLRCRLVEIIVYKAARVCIS